MPVLGKRATTDEQRILLNSLVERVYVDIESQRIGRDHAGGRLP